jgi:hypothetical protein
MFDVEICEELQSTSSFPTVMHTLVASIETTGELGLRGCGDAFSNCDSSSVFPARIAVNSINIVIWKRNSHEVSDVSLKTGPHLYVSLAVLY